MLVQRHCAVYIHLHMLDFLFVRLVAVMVQWSSSQSDGAETTIYQSAGLTPIGCIHSMSRAGCKRFQPGISTYLVHTVIGLFHFDSDVSQVLTTHNYSQVGLDQGL